MLADPARDTPISFFQSTAATSAGVGAQPRSFNTVSPQTVAASAKTPSRMRLGRPQSAPARLAMAEIAASVKPSRDSIGCSGALVAARSRQA